MDCFSKWDSSNRNSSRDCPFHINYMKLRELHTKPIYKNTSQRNSLPGRSHQLLESYQVNRTPKTKSKVKTQANDSPFLTNLQPYSVRKPRRGFLTPVKSTARQGPTLAARNRSNSTKSRQFMLQRGKGLYKDNQMDQAITLFRGLLNEEYKPQLLFYLGSACLNKEQYSVAAGYLSQIVKSSPQYNKDVYMLLSIAYKKMKQYEKAIRTLQEATKYYGDFEQAHVYLAKLYMKIKSYNLALRQFEQCLKLNPKNILSLIGVADTLRSQGKLAEAVARYTQALSHNTKYNLVCLLKRMTAYYQLHQYQAANQDADNLIASKVNSSQLYYFKGMLTLDSDPNKAIVYFEQALQLNNLASAVTCSLEQLLKLRIIQKDFYAAIHTIGRINHLNTNKQKLQPICTFIQAAIDSIKRRYPQCISKLLTLQQSKCTGTTMDLIHKQVPLYLGYCHISTQQYTRALQQYQLAKDKSPAVMYNTAICQGILLHKHNHYQLAALKFQQAKEYLPLRIQPYFYKAINIIQQGYNSQTKPNSATLLDSACTQLELGNRLTTNNSLFYFYCAVVYLLKGSPDLTLILKAIDKSQDNIAEYFFVKAIILSHASNYEEALVDFCNALMVDPEGVEFLKQRSKCLYMLGRYDQALVDIKKCLAKIPYDYQSRLLLCFYLYAIGNYQSSLQFLKETASQAGQTSKINTFLQSLNFRLKNYQEAGTIGSIINSLKHSKPLNPQAILQVDHHLQNKQLLCQFPVGHLLCLKGVVLLYEKDYPGSADCFHHALQEVKNSIQIDTDQASIDSENQLRIYEVKFNMIIQTLCQDNLQKALTLTKMLIDDTEMTQLVEQLKALQKALEDAIIGKAGTPFDLFLFQGKMSLLSQEFPLMTFTLSSTCTIRTRPILFYPQKLTFNITPQLTQDLLRCFTLDKIQDKPQPPWITRSQQSTIFFTDNVELRGSVEVSSVAGQAGQPQQAPPTTRQKLRLNSAVEAKLNKLLYAE